MSKAMVRKSDDLKSLLTVEMSRPQTGSFQVELADSYCGSPGCPCNSATLKPYAVSGHAADDIAEELGELENLSIFVDLETGEVKPAEERPSELIASIAEALNLELDDDLLEEMREGYATAKTRGREEQAWRQKDWSWLKPGETLGWVELFPSDGYFAAGVDSSLLIADQYCWDPTCDCHKAVLTLVERVGTGDEEYVTLAVYRYNLKTKKTEVEPLSPSVKRSAKSVFREWLGDPNVHRALRFRYDYINAEFGGKLLTERSIPSPVTKKAKKIGRNDPCSCGSGKKFKKCCLGS
jgi:hypothetical protein